MYYCGPRILDTILSAFCARTSLPCVPLKRGSLRRKAEAARVPGRRCWSYSTLSSCLLFDTLREQEAVVALPASMGLSCLACRHEQRFRALMRHPAFQDLFEPERFIAQDRLKPPERRGRWCWITARTSSHPLASLFCENKKGGCLFSAFR